MVKGNEMAIATRILLLLLCCMPFFGHATDFLCIRGPHSFSIGPEAYYMVRAREGGSRQYGGLYGGRFCYERLRRSAVYWGVEGYWAKGRLKGHDGLDRVIKSTKTDMEIEGRLGYSLKWRWCIPISFTPFFCGGYFRENNKFIDPSPLECTISEYFPYAGMGFLSRFYATDKFSVGLNFKTKYMLGAKCRVGDDPFNDDINLIIEDKFIYDLDVPLTYSFCACGQALETSFVPFFRYRQYGRHEDYPFDYLGTRYQIYGARLMVTIIF